LKCALAVAFESLSRIVAIFLVLLTLCPCTAPFSTYDITAEASPLQETFDPVAKTISALPVLASPFVLVSPIGVHRLPDPSPVALEAALSPRRSVLRL